MMTAEILRELYIKVDTVTQLEKIANKLELETEINPDGVTELVFFFSSLELGSYFTKEDLEDTLFSEFYNFLLLGQEEGVYIISVEAMTNE
jgi:hypothetical protein